MGFKIQLQVVAMCHTSRSRVNELELQDFGFRIQEGYEITVSEPHLHACIYQIEPVVAEHQPGGTRKETSNREASWELKSLPSLQAMLQ